MGIQYSTMLVLLVMYKIVSNAKQQILVINVNLPSILPAMPARPAQTLTVTHAQLQTNAAHALMGIQSSTTPAWHVMYKIVRLARPPTLVTLALLASPSSIINAWAAMSRTVNNVKL